MFARYAQRLEGSAALASWLTERGYRTKQGKPFNPHAVLTMLRNRVYLGEVYFRGQHHAAPHQPLVDRESFDRAQEILASRGEDASLRHSDQSDYLLTGLVTCAQCGKRYLGAAAHGNGGRYSDYVCITRQRYGTAHCDSDRLPAPALEDAILEGLHARRDELAPDDTQTSEALSDEDLRALQTHARHVITTGDPPARKALLQALVADIRVVSRHEIDPTVSCPRFDHRADQYPQRGSNPRYQRERLACSPLHHGGAPRIVSAEP